MTENNLFKGFTTKGVKGIKNSLASFTAMVDDDADLPARNLPQREDIPCDAAVKLAGLLLVVIFEQLLQ